jgi:hypothetical protein
MAFFEQAMLLETDECIRWPYGHTSAGYGRIYIGTSREDNRNTTVHELACIRAHGPCPPGMQVAHNVGCPRDCFNPRHLRWDTVKGNLADRVADGTLRRGVSHPRAKLTERQVKQIRRRYAKGGITMTQLAEQYGLEKSSVRNLIRRKTWKHLED